MKTETQLKEAILKLDGRGYPAYKSLKGSYAFGDYVLTVEHVQGDPFAAPSELSVTVADPGFPAWMYAEPWEKTALQDHVLRGFGRALAGLDTGRAGSGKSGRLSVSRCTQEVLERTSCVLDKHNGALSVRFSLGLPARGRTILAAPLIRIVFSLLPPVIRSTLVYTNYSSAEKHALEQAVRLSQDQHAIREALKEQHLVSFVADGAVLPRESGVSALPMRGATPFTAPESLRVTIETPNAGTLTGMGISEGITLIVGGGYHGKSTLLDALTLGVYDHIAGDGREYVITRDDAVRLRAEDGRAVHDEDISMFINTLPGGKDTTCFTTENASGSTSQAAAVTEALETGTGLLLMDEDTSATNFMIRDALMAEVIAPEDEPIQPYLSRIRSLARAGVSTILAAGSSGAYFKPADTIIQMQDYTPIDITQKAKAAADAFGAPEETEDGALNTPPVRVPLPNPALNNPRPKIKTTALDTLTLSREAVDVRCLEQLADSEQLAGVGALLCFAGEHLIDGTRTTRDILDAIEARLDRDGIGALSRVRCARPRRAELLGALSRMRSQRFNQQKRD